MMIHDPVILSLHTATASHELITERKEAELLIENYNPLVPKKLEIEGVINHCDANKLTVIFNAEAIIIIIIQELNANVK